jgi:tetratricopeptide (TPR) repeat protein
MRRLRVLGLLATWIATTTPCVAGEDGGTQSVFAVGAGNRGLAMGSAFVAAADDASAVVWNAAGLGSVSRAELQFVQSAGLGLEFQENFATAVLPSWRWGTVALALRTFGVGGIERRDERNQLLEDDLSDRHLELGVGYGRGWGRGLRLGGAFKLRRQSLAGLTASGLGFDLGAQLEPAAAMGIDAPWMRDWTLGLSIQNLIPPTLRLVHDATTDPTSVRSGIAWRQQAGPFGEILTEVDVVAAANRDFRAGLGVECRPSPWVAVRAGADARGMAAGTSVRWHDVSIDYAFQDAALSAEHRVGLSFRFGSTTDESRAAGQQREDRSLQERWTKAFERQQAEKVAELLERAQEAHGRGELEETLDLLGAIQLLEPGHGAARALENECLHDKAGRLERSGDLAEASIVWDLALAGSPADSVARAGALRCRAELDRRAARTSETRERFTRALDAFVTGQLDSARAGFTAVLRLNPADPDAAAMLRRTESAIARRTAQTRAATALPPAPVARPKTEEPRQEPDGRAESLYRQGLAAWREGRADDAVRFWELVFSMHPGYREVNGLLVREYLTRGIDAFAGGRLTEAIGYCERALRVDPADARARGYLTRAQEQLARSRAIRDTR